ncbi:uncharacterized protein LOC115220341 isoform X2 [Octopus sinensis]|nr:uncharacterized protein LOC115220341 isoform X2 [Octopus sinensis]XP_036365797.1 uncharacterized protein LOC115220341 isoform X2 [Octopus sinensis]
MRILKCWHSKYGLCLQRPRVAVITLIILLVTLWLVYVKTPCFKTELDPKYLQMLPSEDVVSMSMKEKLKAFEHSENVTLVTAYFQLDTFRKGGNSHVNPKVYKKWCSVYSRILNPVVFFTDSPEILSMFKKLRSPSLNNLTKLILVNRTDLWAFSLKPRIAKIFSQADYPKFHPNTVIPDYSCVMHAKYELLKKSIQQNYFHTNFFMWIDFGYFRYEVNKTENFGLSLPKGFDFRSVAFSLECNFQKIPLKEIIWKNLVWVAGGANLGRYDVLTRFCDDYISSVKRALNQNLMSTDQQIIYAMSVYRSWSSTTLQLCHAGWFCLGYLAKDAWEQQHK